MGDKDKKILLVDDDPDMLDIGRVIIRRAGYQYLSASSGEEGLKKVVSESPHLIILDYMMPKIDGSTFFKKLKNDSKYKQYRDIPVIMLTARSDNQINQTELFEEGLSAFLIKPFGHRELINVVENVLKVSDIRKRNIELEKEIQRTRYKYRDLIENANDLIFMLDRDGKISFINQQLTSLIQVDPGDWMGRFLVDLVIPQDKSNVEEAIASCKQGNPYDFQLRIRAKSNVIRYFSVNLSPIHEHDTAAEGMVGIARDITEKYRLETRIASLESFTESIIKSMSSGLITVDQNRRVTYYNSTAEKILGYKSTDVLKQKIDDILPDGESEILLHKDSENNRAEFSQEMEITGRNGNKVHIGFSRTPWVDSHNNFLGSIITFRDISETKQMQIEMVRMDRLASLGVLAAGIAHEIRNPLAGIKTMTQALEEEVENDDPQKEYLHRIIRQVNRLDELLKAFFSYARPRPPIKKYHRFQDIMHEVSILLEKRLKTHNVGFQKNFSKNLKPIYVDLNQIQQIFINLIINALEAMPDGGELEISAKNVKARPVKRERRGRSYQSPQKVSSYVEVTVKDTGMGIRSEHLDTIFDPFFTTKTQGTGLGLSIVYRIIEEHNGDITVNSKLNKGSTFKILLPTEE